MLEYTFGLIEEATAVQTAMEATLNAGITTRDLKGHASTEQVGQAICEAIG
jgi:3-isopropylmalate dehydrogenase